MGAGSTGDESDTFGHPRNQKQECNLKAKYSIEIIRHYEVLKFLEIGHEGLRKILNYVLDSGSYCGGSMTDEI